jgi:hypothetical protein
MNIIIRTCDGVIKTTLERQLADDDGLREEQDEIRKTLGRGRTYCGGGGASPPFTIRKDK